MLFINFNGEIYPADAKLLSVANRGFRYGDGLFESMRLMKGELKFADMHADRLQRGMKALKLDNYSQMDAWFLKEKVADIAMRNKSQARSSAFNRFPRCRGFVCTYLK